MTDILVQKFGGTSLSTRGKVRAAAARVRRASTDGYAVVVVVSARGSATDELLATAAEFGVEGPGRELDQLLATGEYASAALFAITLGSLSVPAVSLTGSQAGITVAGRPGRAVIADIDTTRIHHELDAGRVVVVGGFQGMSPNGDVHTLGRGGSDTTAVALAATTGAVRCEIYTDVNAVYTADPRIVSDARPVLTLPHEVMAEMAFAGAKVLNSRSVELAAMNDIELHLRSSLNEAAGTTMKRGGNALLETEGTIVAITQDTDVARVLVRSRARDDLASDVLAVLAEHAVPVDLVARSGPAEDEFRMGFTIRRGDIAEVRGQLDALAARRDGMVRVDTEVAKVSLIGMGLLNRPEYVARMTAVLAAAGIATSWVSTSQMRASVTVPADRVTEAITLLHKEFALAEIPAEKPTAATFA